MKSIFAETIDKVVEEVLQLGKSIIKIEEAEQPTQIAGFREIKESSRTAIDGHWKVIGKEKDDRETARIVAYK